MANKAATCLYALKTLKAHGLQGQAIRDVTLATLVAQLLYASPAWVYQVWRKSQITVGLKHDSSLRVFARVEPQNDQRVTWIIRYHSVQSSSKKSRPRHTPTPPTSKAPGYNLRKRSHGLLLPTTQSNLLRKNFVYRMLFKDIYYLLHVLYIACCWATALWQCSH